MRVCFIKDEETDALEILIKIKAVTSFNVRDRLVSSGRMNLQSRLI